MKSMNFDNGWKKQKNKTIALLELSLRELKNIFSKFEIYNLVKHSKIISLQLLITWTVFLNIVDFSIQEQGQGIACLLITLSTHLIWALEIWTCYGRTINWSLRRKINKHAIRRRYLTIRQIITRTRAHDRAANGRIK